MAIHVGDLQETCLEKNYLAFFGENVSVFWRKRSVFFGENRSEILEIWRTLFGKIVVGDLEKAFDDFGENRSAILEKIVRRFWRSLWSIVMLGDRMRRSKVKGEKWRQIMETKTLFIIKWRVHIWNISRVETYKVLDVP